ncbi:MAG: DUF885 family protein [Alphaproteobacteria bacterium]|nr:DUF885 family protein [Alphaproteobacteria bacterium]MBL6938933.1 DUF885 family protein [Alphaproteobacteria bacterium]MBL7099525.1 DUF885 family protein [Alphaproteobacteria bacterium]
MLSRRSVLKSGAASAAALALTTPGFAADAAPSKKLNKLFDTFISENLDLSPTFATSLGVDKGPRAKQKYELDEASLAAIKKGQDLQASQLRRLRAFDRASVPASDQLTYDIVLFNLKNAVADNEKFAYAGGGAGAPYIISQKNGLYSNTPSFLDNQHTIETKEDADAYLSRLEQFGPRLDDEADVVRHDVGLGVIPPDFALTGAVKQIKLLRGQPADSASMTMSLVRRTGEKNIPGDWKTPAAKILNEKVYPALDRQVALLEGLLPKSVHDAGVWRLPKGDEYYHESVLFWTTSTMTPAEIHQTGLDIIKDHSAKIDAIMRQHGMTTGTVGERLRGMYSDPAMLYANTDAAKEQLIADLNVKVKAVRARLPDYFGVLPKAEVVIKRVPKEIEAGQAGGYYNAPSLDGKVPGIYWINLRDTAEQPRWLLPTLTYHEAIPGHHLQLSIQREAKMPLIRRLSYFSSYIEGWALYAEQLADEMGMYADDPIGKIGQLHDAMFRAVRLVVDTGMHAMKWSREQAIKFYVDALGDTESATITEIERYAVTPGQACGYMLGKLTFLAARKKAQDALGAKFDIKSFHDAMLVGGAVPLAMIDTMADAYIAGRRTG